MTRSNKQLIGVTLLSVLMVTYLQYFRTQAPASHPKQVTTTKNRVLQNPTLQIKKDTAPSKFDQSPKTVCLENDDIRVWISSQGGNIQQVGLKKYKTHDQRFVVLVNDQNDHMAWIVSNQQHTINTKDLNFQLTQQGNQVQAICTLGPEKKQRICYTYTLSEKGYKLNYKIAMTGLNPVDDKVKLAWYHAPQNAEQDFDFNLQKTYIEYQAGKKIKYLKSGKNAYARNIERIDAKQRFFTTSIQAPSNEPFTQGRLHTELPQKKDRQTLMQIGMELEVPTKSLGTNSLAYNFYFGPDPDPYLGWWGIKHINKYVIIPLANFLHQYTNHYLWVILLLILIFKLLQTYLLYKDYIVTLKQKALKSELETLKRKYKNQQQAKIAEVQFYASKGIPPSSLFIKLYLVLIQIPLFMSMLYFIPNNIAFRDLPFLWVKDLSSADHFITLPLHIPLLGHHISLFALLMLVPSLIRSIRNEVKIEDPNTKFLKYFAPIIMFLVFNSYPVAFCLYRLCAESLDSVFPKIFDLFVNKKFHLHQLYNSPTKNLVTNQEIPRTIARLDKKRKKKH